MFRKCCQNMNNYGRQNNDAVMEPVINNCVERQFCHEVKHCCPIHTHVVNKHIYNHTYTPQYTCSEENQIVNNDPGCCSKFINNGF